MKSWWIHTRHSLVEHIFLIECFKCAREKKTAQLTVQYEEKAAKVMRHHISCDTPKSVVIIFDEFIYFFTFRFNPTYQNCFSLGERSFIQFIFIVPIHFQFLWCETNNECKKMYTNEKILARYIDGWAKPACFSFENVWSVRGEEIFSFDKLSRRCLNLLFFCVFCFGVYFNN